MTETAPKSGDTPQAKLQRTAWARRVRLFSGLVLFAYVVTHLSAHILALGGLTLVESVRPYIHEVWALPVLQVLLYGALAIHLIFAGYKILFLSTFRNRSRLDWLQLGLGILVVPMLGLHVVGTRGLDWAYGVDSSYAYVVASLVLFSPVEGLLQALTVIVVWTHGCIGIYQWINVKPWFARYQLLLSAVSLIIPLLALGGYATLARETLLLAGTYDTYLREVFEAAMWPGPSAVAWGNQMVPIVRWAVPIAVVVLVLIRWGRLTFLFKYALTHPICYPDGREVRVRPGTSVLDASRQAGIDHASVCGGRGRCSTCRVRVKAEPGMCPPASLDERKVLERVGAPPGVRLACQLVPSGPVAVVPLLSPDASLKDSQSRPSYLSGDEREIVIMFADLRGFTKYSEYKLPFDLVFVLNQYFRVMGQAIEKSGGHIDKFIGDGIMALFGVQHGAKAGAKQALQAAAAMSDQLVQLNKTLEADLPLPLRMGIGLHVGPAIVGELGYGSAKSLTAIGDVVNTASRLEAMTKDYGTELVFSKDVLDMAALPQTFADMHTVPIRGREQVLEVCTVQNGYDLKSIL